MKRSTNGLAAAAVGVAVVSFLAVNVSAATWLGATGPFTNAVNWDAGMTPTNGMTASVNNGGAAQLDGGAAAVGTLNLGEGAGNSGSLSVSAGVLTNAYLFVGKAGTGTVTQTGGAIVTTSSADPTLGIGYNAGGLGTYALSGGSLDMGGIGNLQIGAYGKGVFAQSGGSVTGRGWMVIGRYGTGSGILTVTGGDFCQYSAANRLIAGEAGAGTIIVTNAGTLSLNGGLRLGMVKNNPPNDAGVGTGTVWLCRGGTISTPEVLTQGGSSTFYFDGGLLSARGSQQTYSGFFQGLTAAYVKGGGARIDSGNNWVTISQSLLDDGTGAGGLTKTGAGVLALGGSNTYMGGTVVSNGVLAALVPAALPGYGSAGRVTVCDGAGLTVGVGGAGQWGEAEIGALLASGAFGAGAQFGFDTSRTSVTIGTDLTGAGAFGLLKTGLNTLALTGANGYTGRTVVKGGVLQADFGAGLPSSTNVTLSGGTLSTASGTLSLGLGEGPGQINIVSNAPAGFSAYGAPLTVNLGGAAAALPWGSAAFSPNALLLNEVGADQALTFVNDLNVAGGVRTISVNATAPGTGVSMVGNIGDTVGGGGLAKGGAGALTLAGTNVYTGATYVTGGSLTLAPASSNSIGEVQVSGAARLSVGSATVKQTAGNFVVYGGSADIAGGTVSNLAGYAYIGYNSGVGSLLLNGGYFHAPNELNVGAWAGSTGYLTLSNGTVAARLLYVGRGGNGTVTQTGGSVKLAGVVGSDGWRIGGWGDTTAKGTGVYNLYGGELNSGGQNLQIGCSGNGTLYQTGGTATCGGWPVVGRFGGGSGVYTLEGGAFNQTASGTGRQIIGENGTGTLNVRGSGVAHLVGGLKLAAGSGGVGTVTLGAGGTINTPIVEKGSGSSATFNFNGGVLRARASGAVITNYMQGLNAANVLAGGAVIDSSNSTVTVAQNLASGATPDGGLTKLGTGSLLLSGSNSYNGPTTVSNGVLRIASTNAVPAGSAVAVRGGTLDLGGLAATSGVVTLDSGMIINGTLSAPAFNLTGSGFVYASLAGAGGLTKSGTGTVSLAGANAYGGETRVEGGTLAVATPGVALLRHRWSFNGDLTDSVGGQTATATGAVTFDGSQCTLAGDGTRGSSYVSLGQNILPTDNSPVTVELWAKQNVIRRWSRIFDFGLDTNNNLIMVWVAGLTGDPDYQEIKVGGATLAKTTSTPSPFALGTEYHISMVLTPGAGAGGTLLLQWYVMDGSGATVKSASMSANVSLATFVQQNMWLGHSEYTADPDGNASYNEVRIWNAALTEAQLRDNSLYGPAALPTSMQGIGALPASARVVLSADAALNMNGASQTVAEVSGCGLVTNGTFIVTGTVAPGGTNVIGTLTVDASVSLTGTLLVDAARDGRCDRLAVGESLDLTGLSLQVQDTSLLKPNTVYVVATCAAGGLTGPFKSTNLAQCGWQVGYSAALGHVVLVNQGTLVLVK